jgi:hypothetical protein
MQIYFIMILIVLFYLHKKDIIIYILKLCNFYLTMKMINIMK